METKGKIICNYLRDIRVRIARNNNIKYEPQDCFNQGDCLGFCELCDSELKHIQSQLDLIDNADYSAYQLDTVDDAVFTIEEGEDL